jgi:hypothetical protein
MSLKRPKQSHRRSHRYLISATAVLFGTFLLLGIPIWNPRIAVWIAEAAQAEFVGATPAGAPAHIEIE